MWAELTRVQSWTVLIEAAGALLIAGYCGVAFAGLIARRGGRRRAQRLVGEGALNALSLMVCATLLKTLFLTSWKQIGLFASVLLLRVVLKRVFQAEVRPLAEVGEKSLG